MRLPCRANYSKAVRMAVRLSVGLSTLLAGLVLSGGAFAAKPAPAAKPKTTTVNVVMTEYRFALSAKTVPVGTVLFKLVNKGQVEHNMVFNGPIVYAKSPLVQPGGTYTLKVKFKKPGPYNFVCTLHFELGMAGTIRVK
jgi:plastocyanin